MSSFPVLSSLPVFSPPLPAENNMTEVNVCVYVYRRRSCLPLSFLFLYHVPCLYRGPSPFLCPFLFPCPCRVLFPSPSLDLGPGPGHGPCHAGLDGLPYGAAVVCPVSGKWSGGGTSYPYLDLFLCPCAVPCHLDFSWIKQECTNGSTKACGTSFVWNLNLPIEQNKCYMPKG